tara:strand:- start:95863 stop:96093 length:231 start_codon:yes stop_codon:yes gene_type:complete
MPRDKFYNEIHIVRSALSEDWSSRDDLIRETGLDGYALSLSLRHLVATGRVESENAVARTKKGRKTKGWRLKASTG